MASAAKDNVTEIKTENERKHPDSEKGTEIYSQNHNIAVEVLKTDREFNKIEKEWNELLERSDAHIFQTYEWQYQWWKFFRNKSDLHIITFRHDGILVGVAPFIREEIRVLGIRINRQLRFIASYIPVKGVMSLFANYSPSDFLDMIVDSEYREEVAGAFIRYLDKNEELLDQISLDELAEDSFIMKYVIPKVGEVGWTCDKQEREACPRIDLPDSMHEYLYMVKTSFRHKLRRARRPVTEDNLYEISDVKSDRDFERVFKKLVDLHQERWNKQGYPGVFIDKRYECFMRNVCQAFLLRGRLRMKSAIDHDGNFLAVDLVFAFKDRFYAYQKALNTESDLVKEAPGYALAYFLIEDAIDEKKQVLELLRGVHHYKRRLSTSIVHNWKATLSKPADRRTLIYKLHKWMRKLTQGKLKILQEILIVRIHIREWGLTGFMPRYVTFIRERLNNEH